MKKLLFVVLLVASFLMPLSARAEGSLGEFAAPGGVQWGQTKSELLAAGVELGDCATANGGHFSGCIAAKLPKNLSFAKRYLLLFDEKSGRLVLLTITGKDTTADYYGTEGKALYYKVKKAIAKKYSKHESISNERVGLRLYDESNEFYECLKFPKCGGYGTLFQSKKENGGGILVQLEGSSAGKGHLTVHYESGLFQSLKEKYKQQDFEADEDAL